MLPQSYTFTPAGATGRNGPTQTQVTASYSNTNLNGLVTVSAGIQSWTVPSTGPYRIEAFGAKGGDGAAPTGGSGTKMKGDFTLTAGQVIKILVGQPGTNADMGGGGGASYVLTTTSSPLCIAGGGGGGAYLNMYSYGSANATGTTGTSGQAGINANASVTAGPGGVSGAGGGTVVSSTYTYAVGSGGGGLLGNGQNGSPSTGGLAFINGGTGGLSASNSFGTGGDGGFGGGGGGDWSYWLGGGGGGGYSGGGGGVYNGWGGGGGSINTGSNQVNVSGYNSGPGYVIITKLTGINIAQTASINCNGQLTAALSASAFGGTAPYTYSWSPSNNTGSTVSGLGAGLYTCTAIDASLVVYTSTFLITQPVGISVSIATQSNVSCNGGSNGSVSLSVSGGVSPYTYTWLPGGGNAASLTNLSAGNYTCVVKDQNNCTTSLTTSITQPAPLNVFAFASNPTVCTGGTTALVGAGAVTYTWSGGVTNGIPFSPTITSTYSVTGTDANGCTANAITTVSVNTTPTLSIVGTNSICSGATINLSASGASSYTWSNAANTSSITISPTVTTSYTIVGANGGFCQANAVKTITVLTVPALSLTITNPVVCFGNSTSLTGSGAATYSWTGGITNGTAFVPTTSNTYTLTGANTCGTSTAVASITVNPLPTIGAIASNPIVCLGGTTSLQGTGAVTYLWTGGITNNVAFAPSTITSYSVIGTDANGCQGASAKTITVNPLPTISANASSTLICLGNTVSLTGAGGVSYSWSGGISNGVAFSPSVTSTYTVTGIDANGCQNTSVKTVSVNTTATVTANATNSVICFGNSTTLFGSGASSYTWSGGVTNALAFNPAATANYTVTGSNACGTSTNQITVSVNPLPAIFAIASSPTVCAGYSTSLVAGGAITYTWSGGISNNVAFIPTATSVYTVIGNDLNGCQNTTTQTITVNSLPVLTVSASNSAICVGNTVSLLASGANTYTFSGGVSNGAVFTPVVTQNYSVSGTNTLTGCISNVTVKTITVNALPVVSASATSPTVCQGNTVILNGSGASTYTWSGGIVNGQSFQPSVTGSYSVNGTNTLTGCTSTNQAALSISVVALPIISIAANSASICSGKSATLMASGANGYVWNTSANTSTIVVSPTVSTGYSVSGTSSLTGCSSSVSQTIVVLPLPGLIAVSSSSAICLGGSVSLIAGGAATYTWSNGSTTNPTTVYPTVSTIYTLTGLVGACSNTTTINVVVNPIPVITANSSNSAVCVGNTVALTAGGATNYTWTPNINIGSAFIPTATTVYSVTGTNSLTTCNGGNTATIAVVVNALPTLSVTASNSAVCFGNTLSLNATGASTYSWNNGIINGVAFTPSATSNYSCVGTNTLTGCSNSAAISVSVKPIPVVLASTNQPIVCFGNPVTLTASGASTYTWSNGAVNGVPFTPSASATYSVVGSLAGCTSTNLATQSIFVNPLPVISIVTSKTLICVGETITLTASGAITYTWSNGSNTSFLSDGPTVTSTYSISGTDNNGCENNAVITQSVSDCTSLEQHRENSIGFSVYPNPSHGEFTIHSDEEMTVHIYNELGQLVKHVDLNTSNKSILVSDLDNGVYQLVGKKSSEIFRIKILLSK